MELSELLEKRDSVRFAREFDDKRDLELCRVWVLDRARCTPPHKPLSKWLWVTLQSRAYQVAADTLCTPRTLGAEYRYIQGYYFCGGNIVRDEEERKQREALFGERMAPYIKDPWNEYEKVLTRVKSDLDRLTQFDVERASNLELLVHFEDWIESFKRNWTDHTLMMYVCFIITGLFDKVAKDLIGIDKDSPEFQKLVSGFDNTVFRGNRALWQLSALAVNLGLESIFKNIQDDEILLKKLEETEKGKQWLEKLHEYLEEYGWKVGRIYDPTYPSWVEEPSLAMPSIRMVMFQGAEFTPDQKRGQLERERKKTEQELLSKVPEDKRDWFTQLMKGAQWASYWQEDHAFYHDMYIPALGRRAAIEFGKRFTKAGVIDDLEDINFLYPDEIIASALVMKYRKLKDLVAERKKRWEESCTWDVPDVLGDTDPSAFKELYDSCPILPLFIVLPKAKPELKADLYGAASTSGVVEGVARVVMDFDQLSEVQPGEILVSPFTATSWTPIFSTISAVVTDEGGTLCHSAIEAREHDIPAVVGTLEATKKIKTGQRVKVDGDLGVVYILH